MKIVGYVLLGISGVTAGLLSNEPLQMLLVAILAFIGGTLIGAGTAIDVIYKQLEKEGVFK
jgi:hypothetical protein